MNLFSKWFSFLGYTVALALAVIFFGAEVYGQDGGLAKIGDIQKLIDENRNSQTSKIKAMTIGDSSQHLMPMQLRKATNDSVKNFFGDNANSCNDGVYLLNYFDLKRDVSVEKSIYVCVNTNGIFFFNDKNQASIMDYNDGMNSDDQSLKTRLNELVEKNDPRCKLKSQSFRIVSSAGFSEYCTGEVICQGDEITYTKIDPISGIQNAKSTRISANNEKLLNISEIEKPISIVCAPKNGQCNMTADECVEGTGEITVLPPARAPAALTVDTNKFSDERLNNLEGFSFESFRPARTGAGSGGGSGNGTVSVEARVATPISCSNESSEESNEAYLPYEMMNKFLADQNFIKQMEITKDSQVQGFSFASNTFMIPKVCSNYSVTVELIDFPKVGGGRDFGIGFKLNDSQNRQMKPQALIEDFLKCIGQHKEKEKTSIIFSNAVATNFPPDGKEWDAHVIESMVGPIAGITPPVGIESFQVSVNGKNQCMVRSKKFDQNIVSEAAAKAKAEKFASEEAESELIKNCVAAMNDGNLEKLSSLFGDVNVALVKYLVEQYNDKIEDLKDFDEEDGAKDMAELMESIRDNLVRKVVSKIKSLSGKNDEKNEQAKKLVEELNKLKGITPGLVTKLGSKFGQTSGAAAAYEIDMRLEYLDDYFVKEEGMSFARRVERYTDKMERALKRFEREERRMEEDYERVERARSGDNLYGSRSSLRAASLLRRRAAGVRPGSRQYRAMQREIRRMEGRSELLFRAEQDYLADNGYRSREEARYAQRYGDDYLDDYGDYDYFERGDRLDDYARIDNPVVGSPLAPWYQQQQQPMQQQWLWQQQQQQQQQWLWQQQMQQQPWQQRPFPNWST